jgi:hypothetical protein
VHRDRASRVRAAGCLGAGGDRCVLGTAYTDRCAARPVRHSGDHPHELDPGQSPQVVEDQVTYPLATTMLSVPGATSVRGYSFFGDSYVDVLFDDSTDLYWARSRVLEYLSQVRDRLPAGVTPALGPMRRGSAGSTSTR